MLIALILFTLIFSISANIYVKLGKHIRVEILAEKMQVKFFRMDDSYYVGYVPDERKKIRVFAAVQVKLVQIVRASHKTVLNSTENCYSFKNFR